MVRNTLRIGALASITAVAVVLTYGALSAASPTAAASVEEIMKKGFNKKMGCCPKIGPAVKAGQWDDAQKLSKTLADLGAALPTNACPQGDAKSWEKLCKKFTTDTKTLADACAKKDAAAAEAALKTIGSSCKACHDAHR